MASRSSSAPKATKAPLPNEIISLIVEHLPRDDLSQARHVGKVFAAIAAPRLFETIPLWLGLRSLQALTQLSHHHQLRHCVKAIVFSPLRFVDHDRKDEDEDEGEGEVTYLSRTRSRIRLSTDSSSLSELLFLKHRSAYHAFIEDQRNLTVDELDVSILTHAFEQLPKLENIVLDHGNTTIGANLLHRKLGPFDSADLLTCDCLHPLPVLLRAMATAGVELRSFTIGMMPGFAACGSQTASLLTRDGSWSHKSSRRPESIDPKTLAKTFQDDDICPWHMFNHLRKFKIQEIETDEEDIKATHYLGVATSQLLEMASGLESVTIGRLGSLDDPQTPNLFVHKLFKGSPRSRLRHLDLSDLKAKHQSLVRFIRSQAPVLELIFLRYIELVDGTWSSALTKLRTTRFPALRRFELHGCSDPGFHGDQEKSTFVTDYILRKTDDTPWVWK